jgi:HEAT repeat protein
MPIRSLAVLLGLVLAACSSTPDAGEDAGGPEESADYAELSSPVAKARLESRVENIKYQTGVTLIANLERIAAYGEAAIPVCIEGLKSDDAMTRMGCAWVLGRVGDTRVVPALEERLADDAAFVRYEVASQLGNLGSRSGYPVLVEGLSDERIEYRFKCFEALQELTGQTFGYSHNAAPEVRKVAVEKWAAWLERVESEEL